MSDDTPQGTIPYTGIGVAVGAGVGVTVGALLGGWAIAVGVALGAGVGVVVGAALDASLHQERRQSDRKT